MRMRSEEARLKAAIGVVPSFDSSLIEARADTYRTFAELIKLCDQYITLVLLRVTENTQGGSASDAKAKTEVRKPR